MCIPCHLGDWDKSLKGLHITKVLGPPRPHITSVIGPPGPHISSDMGPGGPDLGGGGGGAYHADTGSPTMYKLSGGSQVNTVSKFFQPSGRHNCFNSCSSIPST